MNNNKSKKSLSSGIFPKPFSKRSPRLPMQMQLSGELWLEFFQGTLAALIGSDNQAIISNANAEKIVDSARVIADLSLDAFEKRWPGLKL